LEQTAGGLHIFILDYLFNKLVHIKDKNAVLNTKARIGFIDCTYNHMIRPVVATAAPMTPKE